MEYIKCKIAKASRPYGSLKKSVFDNKALSVRTKREVYNFGCIIVWIRDFNTKGPHM